MKSIEEKAEELTEERIELSKQESIAYFQGVEAGANYVLDTITECMPKTHSFNPNEVIDIIASRIKELKK